MPNGNAQTEINFDSLFANVSFETDDILNEDSLIDVVGEEQAEVGSESILLELDDLFKNVELI